MYYQISIAVTVALHCRQPFASQTESFSWLCTRFNLYLHLASADGRNLYLSAEGGCVFGGPPVGLLQDEAGIAAAPQPLHERGRGGDVVREDGGEVRAEALRVEKLGAAGLLGAAAEGVEELGEKFCEKLL